MRITRIAALTTALTILETSAAAQSLRMVRNEQLQITGSAARPVLMRTKGDRK